VAACESVNAREECLGGGCGADYTVLGERRHATVEPERLFVGVGAVKRVRDAVGVEEEAVAGRDVDALAAERDRFERIAQRPADLPGQGRGRARPVAELRKWPRNRDLRAR
jgi:hypothetical protein